MPVVARAQERNDLERALRRAQSGVGGLVRVLGEPGIGKTTLARGLFESARLQGMQAGWARPWRGSPPFTLLTDVLRSCYPNASKLSSALGDNATALGVLLPELRAGAAADAGKEALFAALADWLRTSEPLLCVLDDVHEADLASLECLTWLAPRLTGSRVLIVVTERSVGRDSSPEAEAYLSRWPRVAETIGVGPLDVAAVGELLAGRGHTGAPHELHQTVTELTRGNPLFVEGVIHALEGGASLAHLGHALPADLRGVMESWINALGMDERMALAAASLLSREFSSALLGHVLDRDSEFVGRCLEQAERELLVVSRGGHFEFRHPLLAEVLTGTLDAAERSRLHARIADVLVSYFGRTSASQIAFHRLRGVAVSGVELAVQACEQAAAQALAMLGYAEAAEHWHNAAKLLAGAAGASRHHWARLQLERADAVLRSGKRSGARQILDEIWATVCEANPDQAPRTALLTATTGEFGALDRVKFERLESALALATNEGDKIRLKSRLAAELWVDHGALERRLRLSSEALSEAREFGDPDIVFQVIDDRCQALFGSFRDDERQALADELREQARNVEQSLSASRRAMSVLLQRGELVRFASEVESFAAQARLLRQSALEEDALQRLQLVATLDGDFPRALALIQDMRRMGHQIENPQAEMGYRFTRGWIAQVRDERDVLEGIAFAFAEDAARLPNLPFIRSYWALCHAAAGQPAAARKQLARYMQEHFPSLPHDLSRTAGLAFAAECAVLVGERDALAPLLGCLRLEPGPFVSVGSTLCYGALDYFVGLVEFALGNLEEAGVALARADRLHERSGSPTLQWRSASLLDRLEQRVRPGSNDSHAHRERLQALAQQLGIAMAESEPPLRAAEPTPEARTAELRRQGPGWALHWGGRPYLLPDAKGIGILATLLDAPGRRVHVLDLVDAGEFKHEGRDAPVLDKQALASYRQRRDALRQAEQDAETAGDGVALHAARAEREAIEDALESALGLGGRARASGTGERARSAVAKALKRALHIIAETCADAAAHLTRSVRTGTFCVYDPDPKVRIVWTIER